MKIKITKYPALPVNASVTSHISHGGVLKRYIPTAFVAPTISPLEMFCLTSHAQIPKGFAREQLRN